MLKKQVKRLCTGLACVALASVVMPQQASAQADSWRGWFAHFINVRVHDKWTLYADYQIRSTDNIDNLGQVLIRPGLTYHWKSNISATVGYTGVFNYLSTPIADREWMPEHRAFQQLVFRSDMKGFSEFQNRIRLEERFIGKPSQSNPGDIYYDNALRVRHFIRGVIPFSPYEKRDRKFFFIALQNEIFLNIGNQQADNGQFFGQNRAYAAAGFKFSPKLSLEAGYMNLTMNSGSSAQSRHIIQIMAFSNFDLRKKQ